MDTTGQANIASMTQVKIVTTSEKISKNLRARGGSASTTTSILI